MLTNADITIFNAYPDREGKKVIYIPRHIPRVWFYKNQKTSVSTGALTSADEYKIRIPYSECADWMPADRFSEQTKTEGKWTVQNGDFFLLGAWQGEAVRGIEEIKKGFSGEVGRVLSHSENFFGSSPHIRIGGGA